jgi:hypothetical protein
MLCVVLQGSDEWLAGAGDCAVDLWLLETHLVHRGRAHGPVASQSKLCLFLFSRTKPAHYTIYIYRRTLRCVCRAVWAAIAQSV